MATRPTLTLGLCLTAGVAAGIGLARPGPSPAGTPVVTQYSAPTTESEPVDLSDPYAAPTQQPAPQPAAAVTIAGFDFGAPLSVGPGASITVTNADGVPHTLTANDGAFDTGAVPANGAVPISAPTEPGVYQFFCTIHPSMQGTLTVSQ